MHLRHSSFGIHSSFVIRNSSLNSETTASGRGRVEALPFRREQRLHENLRAVRARVVVRDAAWPIQKMSEVRWKPLPPPTFADASGSRSVARRAAVSPTPPLGGLPDTTPYGGGASLVIRHWTLAITRRRRAFA